MNLVDVKRTPADKKKEKERWDEPSRDDYPWGLAIQLDNETIDKMGLGDLNADETVRIYAEAFVANDNVNKENGKTVRSVKLQITKMAVAQSDNDDEAAEDMYKET